MRCGGSQAVLSRRRLREGGSAVAPVYRPPSQSSRNSDWLRRDRWRDFFESLTGSPQALSGSSNHTARWAVLITPSAFVRPSSLVDLRPHTSLRDGGTPPTEAACPEPCFALVLGLLILTRAREKIRESVSVLAHGRSFRTTPTACQVVCRFTEAHFRGDPQEIGRDVGCAPNIRLTVPLVYLQVRPTHSNLTAQHLL